MKCERIKFVPQHALDIAQGNLRDERELPEGLSKWAYAASNEGPAYSLSCDGQIIACGGIHKVWPGYGEAWMLISNDSLPATKTLLRMTRITLSEMIEQEKLVRVEANVRCDRGDFINWISHLGFTCIAKRRHYGPDSADYFLFERVA